MTHFYRGCLGFLPHGLIRAGEAARSGMDEQCRAHHEAQIGCGTRHATSGSTLQAQCRRNMKSSRVASTIQGGPRSEINTREAHPRVSGDEDGQLRRQRAMKSRTRILQVRSGPVGDSNPLLEPRVGFPVTSWLSGEWACEGRKGESSVTQQELEAGRSFPQFKSGPATTQRPAFTPSATWPGFCPSGLTRPSIS